MVHANPPDSFRQAQLEFEKEHTNAMRIAGVEKEDYLKYDGFSYVDAIGDVIFVGLFMASAYPVYLIATS
jgi:hypothetical protein